MPLSEASFGSTSALDLFEGDQHAIARIRKLKFFAEDEATVHFRPFILVNLVSCLEWYARSKIKQLIDFHSERINTNARLLRDAKVNYPLLLRSQRQNFSLGDIIAASKNFSSVEDIENSIADLIVRSNSDYSALFQEIISRMRIRPAFARDRLERLFKIRHEIIHGTPRNLIYDDSIAALASKRDVQAYIVCSLEFIAAHERFLRSSIKEYRERSNLDIRLNQVDRLTRADDRLSELERSIAKRLPTEHLPTFAKAQRAWKLWRGREAEFQSFPWAGGTGQIPAMLGEETTLTLDRVRQLEALLRELSKLDL